MLTFGVIVEGDYDAAVLPELLRKCRRDDVEVMVRICNSKTSLMQRFPGFLEEFWYLKQGLPVDRALVVRDADTREPQGLLRAMEARIAQRTYAFSPVRFVVIVQELETWLLADDAALAAVTRQYSGRRVSAVNEILEDIADSKNRLQRLLAEVQVPYTQEVARKIALAIDVDILAYRCPSFRSFQQAVQED